MKGGIVWRIAIESLNLLNAVDGPSEIVFELGRCFAGNDGENYWDDWLTDDEIDLICGVYQVKTGAYFIAFYCYNFNHPIETRNQTSAKSWWPRPAVFENSGLWSGYWTPACETWYCNRRKAIFDRASGPYAAVGWKNALTMSTGAKRITVANEYLSSRFLEGVRFGV